MQRYLTGIGIIISIVAASAYVSDNPYFKITNTDVIFKTPAGFPKPVYDISANQPTAAVFTLGRKLFYDPILSRDYFLSCATCHQQFAAFAHIDHALSHGVFGRIGKRNVPALQNLAWSNTFMADGGINHLDLQPIAPLTGETEMDQTLSEVLHKLQRDSVYPALFREAYGDTLISSERLMKALSQFLVLMTSSNSRYDQYLANKSIFSESEKRGLKHFRSKCASCHKEPLFTDYSFRNTGIIPDPSIQDAGRYLITGNPQDSLKFRVPSLRNVEMTYPYMHDGSFRTLEKVMQHYAGLNTENTRADKMLAKTSGISVTDQQDIIAFLKTLTDSTFLHDRRFMDPATQ
jgi:cytochrome c peroxidase